MAVGKLLLEDFTKLYEKEFGQKTEKEIIEHLSGNGYKVNKGVIANSKDMGEGLSYMVKSHDDIMKDLISSKSENDVIRRNRILKKQADGTGYSLDELNILRQDQINRTANNSIRGDGFNQSDLIRHSPTVENVNSSVNNKNQAIFNDRIHRSSTTSSNSADVLMSENIKNDLSKTSAFADDEAMKNYYNNNKRANITSEEFNTQVKKKAELEERFGRDVLEKRMKEKLDKTSAGSAAMEKDNAGKMDALLKKAVPIAVGGGLVFSMFGSRGQQSNAQLYGQQQAYGGGY